MKAVAIDIKKLTYYLIYTSKHRRGDYIADLLHVNLTEQQKLNACLNILHKFLSSNEEIYTLTPIAKILLAGFYFNYAQHITLGDDDGISTWLFQNHQRLRAVAQSVTLDAISPFTSMATALTKYAIEGNPQNVFTQLSLLSAQNIEPDILLTEQLKVLAQFVKLGAHVAYVDSSLAYEIRALLLSFCYIIQHHFSKMSTPDAASVLEWTQNNLGHDTIGILFKIVNYRLDHTLSETVFDGFLTVNAHSYSNSPAPQVGGPVDNDDNDDNHNSLRLR